MVVASMLVVEPLAAAMAGVADACGKRGGAGEREGEREREREIERLHPPSLLAFVSSFFLQAHSVPFFPFLPSCLRPLACIFPSKQSE